MAAGIYWRTQKGMQSLADVRTLKIAWQVQINNQASGSIAIPPALGLTAANSLVLLRAIDGQRVPYMTRNGNQVSWTQLSDFPSTDTFRVMVLRIK